MHLFQRKIFFHSPKDLIRKYKNRACQKNIPENLDAGNRCIEHLLSIQLFFQEQIIIEIHQFPKDPQ